MAARRPFWKWHRWKSIGFCLWPPSTCIWNLKLKFQSKLMLRKPCRLQTDGRTDGQTDKVNPVYPPSNFVGRGYKKPHFPIHILFKYFFKGVLGVLGVVVLGCWGGGGGVGVLGGVGGGGKFSTVKPVCNNHLYNKINYLWFSQWCVLMKTEGTNLFMLTISALDELQKAEKYPIRWSL